MNTWIKACENLILEMALDCRNPAPFLMIVKLIFQGIANIAKPIGTLGKSTVFTPVLFAGVTLSVYFLAHVNVVVAQFRSNAMSVTSFNGYFVN